MDDPTRWCENDASIETRLPGLPVPSGSPSFFLPTDIATAGSHAHTHLVTDRPKSVVGIYRWLIHFPCDRNPGLPKHVRDLCVA